jgi:hypothetical protein
VKTKNINLFVAGFFGMTMVFASIVVGQTPISAPVSSQELSGVDRYPLPKEGLVPDKETAIKIAEAVLFRLYGEDSIKGQRPYVVREADYIWWISGTLPKGNFGQVFNIGISKHTAAILRLTVGEDKVAAGK